MTRRKAKLEASRCSQITKPGMADLTFLRGIAAGHRRTSDPKPRQSRGVARVGSGTLEHDREVAELFGYFSDTFAERKTRKAHNLDQRACLALAVASRPARHSWQVMNVGLVEEQTHFLVEGLGSDSSNLADHGLGFSLGAKFIREHILLARHNWPGRDRPDRQRAGKPPAATCIATLRPSSASSSALPATRARRARPIFRAPHRPPSCARDSAPRRAVAGRSGPVARRKVMYSSHRLWRRYRRSPPQRA